MIELLAVVVIIGILIAVLVPGYQRMVSSSLGAKNMANHRAIAGGLITYAQEHKGRLPWANDTDPPFGNGASSMPNSYSPYPKTLVAMGYLDDGRVFFGPMFWPRWENQNIMSELIRHPDLYPVPIVPWAYTNYGANRHGAMPEGTSPGGRQPANLLRVAGDGNLSKLMLTRDTYVPDNDTPGAPYGGGIYWFVGTGSIPDEKNTYGGIVHASFADGHVEGFKRQALIDLINNASSGKAPLFKNVYTFDP